MENTNDSQKIIALLEEQNKTLQALLNFQLLQERKAFQHNILSLIFHAIPYIALIIIGYFIYQSIHTYLDALNNNINTLRDGFISFQNSLSKLIPDFSKITNGIENTWQSAKNIFN